MGPFEYWAATLAGAIMMGIGSMMLSEDLERSPELD
jgi:hypothetical protein